jgi:hypothetical protein
VHGSRLDAPWAPAGETVLTQRAGKHLPQRWFRRVQYLKHAFGNYKRRARAILPPSRRQPY